MSQCDYWLPDGTVEWCGISNSDCDCGGDQQQCPLTDQAIASALKEEEKATLEEASIRARKRRGLQDAS